MNRRSRRRNAGGLRAFTLVELLVVIGIIAVLISILLPSLSRARQAAETVACLSNMRQIQTALLYYANDNQGWVPPGNGFEDAAGNFATPLTLGYDYPSWATNQWPDYIHLGKYTPNPHPANSSSRNGIAGCTNFNRSTVWTCPSDEADGFSDGNGRFVSYAVYGDAWAMRNQWQAPWQRKSQYLDQLWKLTRVKRPAEMAFAVDAPAKNGRALWGWDWGVAGPDMTSVSLRHNSKKMLNVVYIDGHAETEGDFFNRVKTKEIKRFPNDQ